MDWAVEFVTSVDRDTVRFIRVTLEAKLKSETGNYGEAARMLWELLIEARHDKKRDWECITLVHMAKVYRVLRWSIASKLLADALQLSESLDFKLAKAMALAETGEMKCQWGKFDESLELFGKALELVDPTDAAGRRSILLDTAIAHEGLDHLERCREILREVLLIDQELAPPDKDEDVDHLKRIETTLAAQRRGAAPAGSTR
jgi:tetratricopeptide (TPR) repeat protein